MTDTETNGRIIKVGNPNRLVKYAQKHPEEDFFFHGDTGVLREGGRIVLGETWYYITGDVFPVYENGIYMGAKWFNDELSELPELSGLLRGIIEMGLDMYLIKKYYIGAQSEYNNITGTVEIYQQGVKIPIEINDIKYIESEAVYWRKANMIHKWFVDHAQEGTDDCKQYYVSREQLKELLGTCKLVIENHELAGELLPTQDGFFFGSTEYDDEYFKNVEYTVEQLSKLDLSQNTGFCYYYESSW